MFDAVLLHFPAIMFDESFETAVCWGLGVWGRRGGFENEWLSAVGGVVGLGGSATVRVKGL